MAETPYLGQDGASCLYLILVLPTSALISMTSNYIKSLNLDLKLGFDAAAGMTDILVPLL